MIIAIKKRVSSSRTVVINYERKLQVYCEDNDYCNKKKLHKKKNQKKKKRRSELSQIKTNMTGPMIGKFVLCNVSNALQESVINSTTFVSLCF